MRPRSSRLFALTVAGITLATAGVPPAAAQPTPPSPSQSQGGLLQQRLGLSEDQMKTIQEINQREMQAGAQNRQALRRAESDLRRLVMKGAADAATQTKAAEVKKLLADSVDFRVKALREIAAILTPEQREKFVQLGEPVSGEARPPRGRAAPGRP